MNIQEFALKHLSNATLRGPEIQSECPFCKEPNKKKFYLNIETGKYLCFRGSCGAKGGIDALKKHFGIESDLQPTKVKPIRKHKPTEKVRIKKENFELLNNYQIEYLESRKISKETAKAMRVLARGKNFAFFLTDGPNNVVGVKYRDISKNIFAESNSKSTLWNKDLVEGDSIIITEGEIDAMTVYEAGFKNVVSVPFGTSNFDWISNDWEWLNSKKEIILLMDNDAAGQKAEHKLLSKLNFNTLKVCTLGKYKDINEVAVTDGLIACREVINNAKKPNIPGVTDIKDIARFDINRIDRFLTGIKTIDKMLRGLKETELTIIAGDNGSGKSTLIAQIILNAIEQNRKAFVFNGELSQEMFKEWLFLQANGSSDLVSIVDQLVGETDYVVNDENYHKINDWTKGKLQIFTDKKLTSGSELIEKMIQSYKRDNTFLFVIDNLTTVKMKDENSPRHQQQGDFTNELKEFAKAYNVHVILVNHTIKSETNKGKHLIKGSGVITDIADNVLMPEIIKDSEEEHNGEIHIEKNRIFGAEGTIRTYFDYRSKRICDFKDRFEETEKKYSWEKFENNEFIEPFPE